MSVALSCWDETRGPKTTYRRESLLEFIVLEGESIRAGSYSSRYDSGRELGAHGLDCRQRADENQMETGDGKLSKPATRDTLPPARPPLLSLPKERHQLGTKYLNMGTFLIKTTMVNILVSCCANS